MCSVIDSIRRNHWAVQNKSTFLLIYLVGNLSKVTGKAEGSTFRNYQAKSASLICTVVFGSEGRLEDLTSLK